MNREVYLYGAEVWARKVSGGPKRAIEYAKRHDVHYAFRFGPDWLVSMSRPQIADVIWHNPLATQ